MALFDCPECGNSVSDRATACPRCGFPVKAPPQDNTSKQEQTGSIEDSDDKGGYIYILSNPSFGQDLYKIGKTTRSPEERAHELSSHTGVPAGFQVEFSRLVNDCHEAETMIHGALKRYRGRREFFEIALERAVDIVEAICSVFDPVDTGPPRYDPDEDQALSEEICSDDSTPERTAISEELEGSPSDRGVTSSTEQYGPHGSADEFKLVQGVQAVCSNCGRKYRVTLVRYEEQSTCPECLRHHSVTVKW